MRLTDLRKNDIAMKKQTKTTRPIHRNATLDPTPAAVPEKTAPPSYGPSTFTLFSQVYANADRSDREFLVRFLEKCGETDRVPKAAVLTAASFYQSDWVAESLYGSGRDSVAVEHLHAIQVKKTWLRDCLNAIIFAHIDNPGLTPEDVLAEVQVHAAKFQTNIEETRKLLSDFPQTIANEVSAAVRKQPWVFPR